jgi:hypothetical protein
MRTPRGRRRGGASKAQKLFLPKSLRSAPRIAKLHAEAQSEAKRLHEAKLNAERNAGLRV